MICSKSSLKEGKGQKRRCKIAQLAKRIKHKKVHLTGPKMGCKIAKKE